MKITEHEMQGLLTGKCIPAKMKVNESLAAFLVRQFGALHEQVQALAAENAALKSRTITVPEKFYAKDMYCNAVRWADIIDAISSAGVAFVREDGEMIAGTRETPATDAAIRDIKAQGVDEYAQVFCENAVMDSACNKGFYHGALDYAALLRAGEVV